MEWSDIGVVLGSRRLGEANAVVELMTREHGRHFGLVHGGASARRRALLQAGNLVQAVWRARLDEHLGFYALDAIDLRTAALVRAAHALYGVHHLAALCRLLPERDPHPELFELLETTLGALGEAAAAAASVARFELQLLAALGFGLDLSACAATAATADLSYVSPKSGRAVSRSAGEPWRDKLLALPLFLRGGPGEPDAGELWDAFALTGYFLARHVFEPKAEKLPAPRAQFIAAVLSAFG